MTQLTTTISTSPLRWAEYWPKRMGENIVNKIHHGILKCILLFIYIFLNLINEQKMEHIKIIYLLPLPLCSSMAGLLFLK